MKRMIKDVVKTDVQRGNQKYQTKRSYIKASLLFGRVWYRKHVNLFKWLGMKSSGCLGFLIIRIVEKKTISISYDTSESFWIAMEMF